MYSTDKKLNIFLQNKFMTNDNNINVGNECSIANSRYGKYNVQVFLLYYELLYETLYCTLSASICAMNYILQIILTRVYILNSIVSLSCLFMFTVHVDALLIEPNKTPIHSNDLFSFTIFTINVASIISIFNCTPFILVDKFYKKFINATYRNVFLYNTDKIKSIIKVHLTSMHCLFLIVLCYTIFIYSVFNQLVIIKRKQINKALKRFKIIAAYLHINKQLTRQYSTLKSVCCLSYTSIVKPHKCAMLMYMYEVRQNSISRYKIFYYILVLCCKYKPRLNKVIIIIGMFNLPKGIFVIFMKINPNTIDTSHVVSSLSAQLTAFKVIFNFPKTCVLFIVTGINLNVTQSINSVNINIC